MISTSDENGACFRHGHCTWEPEIHPCDLRNLDWQTIHIGQGWNRLWIQVQNIDPVYSRIISSVDVNLLWFQMFNHRCTRRDKKCNKGKTRNRRTSVVFFPEALTPLGILSKTPGTPSPGFSTCLHLCVKHNTAVFPKVHSGRSMLFEHNVKLGTLFFLFLFFS